MKCWRLTKARHADTAFSGYGALHRSGRWHQKGTPVAYASESPSLALLEVLVHDDNRELLDFDYVAVPLTFGEEHLEVLGDLPDGWNGWPWPPQTQRIGTRWQREGRSVVLRVPSAVVPAQSNYLVNPEHPDFGELEVGTARPFPVDERLL